MRGKQIPVEVIHEIMDMHKQGKSSRTIAAATGVGYSTVTRTIKKEKKMELAPSGNGTSSEEKNTTTDIIPEIPADVNPSEEISDDGFCCEVTGDTDMEAYLAQDKYKKTIPDAVKEACLRMREEQLAKIEAALEDIKVYRQQIDEINDFLMGDDPL